MSKDELLEKLEDFVNIKDFVKRLKIDNLYTEEMENFIENYMKYYNV